MDPEKLAQLQRLSFLLEGAGSNDAVVSLSEPDVKLLEIHGSKEMIQVERAETIVGDGKIEVVKKMTKIPAVVRVEKTKAYEVNVGFARQVLELALDGQRLPEEGRIMPEAAPPQEQLETVEG